MTSRAEYRLSKIISRDAELTAVVDQFAPTGGANSNRERWQATFPAVARLRESADWDDFLRAWGARHGSADDPKTQRWLKLAVQYYYYERLKRTQ